MHAQSLYYDSEDPFLDPEEKKKRYIVFRVSDTVFKKLEEKAEEISKTKSDILREYCEDLLK